jgi:DNA-binding Lrp family transcriptional regulator
MKLKLKDSKLLISLFEDSRNSNRQIAKDVGVAKETVASRIEYFEEIGVIKSFSLKTNYDKLGYKEFNLYLRLKNTSKDSLDNIIEYLENHRNTTWIGKTFGRYDLRVSVIVKDHDEIHKIISEFNKEFGKNINFIDYLFVIDKFKASANLFLENIFGEDVIKQYSFSNLKKDEPKTDLETLDNIDKQIIYDLSQNPKQTYAKIAIDTGLTAEAIKYRVKRLENNRYITGNSIVIDGNKFGKIWCSVLLNINSGKMDEFKEFLKKRNFLSNYAETIGNWNFTANFFANNIEELYESLNIVRNKFSEDINNFEFLIIFDFYKFPKLPSCVKD